VAGAIGLPSTTRAGPARIRRDAESR
jgi:hypothetical protein